MKFHFLTVFFSTKELFLVGVILMLLLLVLVLLAYAIILRLIYNIKNVYYTRKQIEWEGILLEYISGSASKTTLSYVNLAYKDWMKFGEFIEEYLVDLRGEDYDAIIQFLWDIQFNTIIKQALDSSDRWEVMYSAYFLGLMKDKTAENKLHKLVFDESPIISVIAFESLSKIGSSKDLYAIIKYIVNSSVFSNYRISEIIMEYGNEINPMLTKLLQDTTITDKGKRLLVDVLASRNYVESLPVIIRIAYQTNDRELTIGCIKALGEFGAPEAVDFLMAQLSSHNWVIRSQAVKSLGTISSREIIPELKIRIRTNNHNQVKLNIAQVLFDFGDRGRKELESLLTMNIGEETASIVRYILYETES